MPSKQTRESSSRENEKRENQTRVPVGSHQDKFTVAGKKSNLSYRWVLRSDTVDHIWEFQMAHWRFVASDEVQVPEPFIHKEDHGSVIRRPAGGGGGYLYLMCIDKKTYNEDQKEKQKEIDKTEEAIFKTFNAEEVTHVSSRGQPDSGFYGKISSSVTRR